MPQPFFSILICTVGKQELTKGAIQSIIDQSEQDFEIIVTDTSGTDTIRDIAASFGDPRIKFFEVPRRDPSASWDFAYIQSSGRYLLWYDDDNCLVPWALESYREIITEDQPDIASANHVYYYGAGNRHNPEYDNVLGVLLPFTLKKDVYRPEEVLAAFYNFSTVKSQTSARWHSAATFFSRTLCEKARERTGHVITPGLLGNFHIHPLLFAYAQKPVYDDRPLSVIGKFGSSGTQQWSLGKIQKEKSYALPFRFTGVSARTLGNTTAECYLVAQNLIPELLGRYRLNFQKFYRRYIDELSLFDAPLGEHLGYWREAFRAIGRPEAETTGRLRLAFYKGMVKSFVVHTLRFFRIWNFVRMKGRHHYIPQNPNRHAVALAPHGVFSINECAQKLDVIFEKEFNLRIKP